MLQSACSVVSLANLAAGFGAPEDLEAVAAAQRIYVGNGGAVLLAPSVHPVFAASAPQASVPEIALLATGPRAAAILGCRRHKLMPTVVAGSAYEIEVLRELISAESIPEARAALADADSFTRIALGAFMSSSATQDALQGPNIVDLYWLHKLTACAGGGRAAAADTMHCAERARFVVPDTAKERQSIEDNYLRRWVAKRGLGHRRAIDAIDPDLSQELMSALHTQLKKFQLETWRH
jgi:hypothetical protein